MIKWNVKAVRLHITRILLKTNKLCDVYILNVITFGFERRWLKIFILIMFISYKYD